MHFKMSADKYVNVSPGIYGIVLGQEDFRSLKSAFMVSLLSRT